MISRHFIVRGSGTDSLVDKLDHSLPVEHRYRRDEATVLFYEKYNLLWTSTNMLITLIVAPRNAEEHEIEAVVGGGRSGFLKTGHGAEEKVLDSVSSDVEDACDELGLRVA